MSLVACRLPAAFSSFPRVSGDEPAQGTRATASLPFSPRERG